MEEYKPNSHLSKQEKREDEKEPEKRVEGAIVTGKVKRRKKGFFRKFTDLFLQEDAQSVGSYIIGDVLIPAFKKTLFEMISNGSEMMIYGEAGRRKKSSGTSSRVSYRSYYDDPRDRDRERYPERRRSYDFDDVELETRGEAENVLARMDEILDKYRIVRVADFFDLVDLPGRYTDNNYGWTDLRNARVCRTHEGTYIIELPKALPIED